MKFDIITIMNRQYPRKNLIFKSVYLACSIVVIAYVLYCLISFVVYGFANGVSFDDCIVLVSSVVAALFEGSIIGFIVRSFHAPTILMKNIVFKNDGTPFLPGLILTLAGCLAALALSVVFGISAYVTPLFKISVRAQYFVFSIGLILFVNFLFTDVYFVTYRHESGSFAII